MPDLSFIQPTKRRKKKFSRRAPPTLAEVSRVLSYEAESGSLKWLQQTSRHIKVGSIAGTKDAHGYIVIGIGGMQWKAHRIAWLLHYGEWPDGWIDHINRQRSDNRISNLRLATPKDNAVNSRGRGKSSSFKGVHYDKKSQRWRSVVRVNLGLFDSEHEAALAYDREAQRVHGSKANLNFGSSS